MLRAPLCRRRVLRPLQGTRLNWLSSRETSVQCGAPPHRRRRSRGRSRPAAPGARPPGRPVMQARAAGRERAALRRRRRLGARIQADGPDADPDAISTFADDSGRTAREHQCSAETCVTSKTRGHLVPNRRAANNGRHPQVPSTSNLWSRGIFRNRAMPCFGNLAGGLGRTPLPHVAVHVVQPPGVGFLLPCRVGCPPAVVFEPAVVSQLRHVVAECEPRLLPARQAYSHCASLGRT